MRTWPRPVLVAIASSLLVAGCAGGPSAPSSAAGASAPPPAATDATGPDDPADAAPTRDEATDDAPPTPERIAAAFAGSEGAHADHHTHHQGATREFPDGIAAPVRIVIPAIGVDADLVDLDLQRAEPEVPTDFDQAGWYTATREPGEIGPAVIAGHVDSRSGPAVFARIGELAAGDEITVHGADGEARTFTVTGSGQHAKGDLPPEVFGFGDPLPELRLITCSGEFDRTSGHYTDNLVVYSQLRDA